MGLHSGYHPVLRVFALKHVYLGDTNLIVFSGASYSTL